MMQEWHIAEVRKINDVCRKSEHINPVSRARNTLAHVYAALLHTFEK